ncbi:MAG: glycosyltransferase family 39 protein [Acidimicrobiales bacterium]|nr:glycosyltransferase family 39 protein [Acidimicrobiales bacterium]
MTDSLATVRPSGSRGAPQGPTSGTLSPPARGPVLAAGAAFLVVELLASPRYGLHRDELYFLACAHHLAWGYVDQPPLVPAVAWLVNGLIGPFAWAFRLLPALAGAASVVLTGLMAREMGGGRCAQTIAAVAAATSAQLLAAFHLLSTTAFDCFFWALITWLVLRLIRTADTRWFVPLGAVVGVALLNKWNVAFLVVALVIGFATGSDRRLLWSKQAWIGAAIALVIVSPDIVWNAQHGWAQLSMLRSLHAENSTTGASIGFLPAQLIVVGPALCVLWITGLVHLWRSLRWRPLAVGYLVLAAWFTLSGAKSYYLAGIYFPLFAGGGVAAERRLRSKGKPGRVRGWITLMVVGGVVALPLTLPLLPESTLPTGSWESQINKDLSATVGWPSYVRQVSGIVNTLPPGERSRLVLLTGDYGAAGAIDLYGPRYHLPAARSGHNTFWWWGPAGMPNESATVAVNISRSALLTVFRRVRLVGSVQTPNNAWTEERGDPIYLCTQQYASWSDVWPALRHYG